MNHNFHPVLGLLGAAVLSLSVSLPHEAQAKTKKQRAKAAPVAALAAINANQLERFNASREAPALRTGNRGLGVMRAQVLLDRNGYSVGEIDGKFAANTKRMLTAYQASHGLRETGTMNAETWAELRDESGHAPVLTAYTITEQDVAGPFEVTPQPMEERAKLKALPYQSVHELLAEKFHISIDALKQLNPRAAFQAGNTLVVPNVLDVPEAPKATLIEIDKSARVLYAVAEDDTIVAAFPISIGNENNDPLPVGTMQVKNEVKNPEFTYNPALLKNAPKEAEKLNLPPGPNNPVGTMWLGLTKPHWGIHGTPNPTNVGHTETNGCIHMTNWDVERLSKMIKAGVTVDVQP